MRRRSLSIYSISMPPKLPRQAEMLERWGMRISAYACYWFDRALIEHFWAEIQEIAKLYWVSRTFGAFTWRRAWHQLYYAL